MTDREDKEPQPETKAEEEVKRVNQTWRTPSIPTENLREKQKLTG